MNNKKCKYFCYRKNLKGKNNEIPKIKKIELIIFDMDGVLTDTLSSWKYIHEYFGSSNERSVQEYLKGKINDMEFIKRDVNLWNENGKPITEKRLTEILSDIPIMKGAKECIKSIKKYNIQTAIVSAGLDLLAQKIAKKLEINYVYANGIKTDMNGHLNGEGIVNVGLIHKDRTVKNISKKLRIPLENIIAVGNSCFDIPMIEICGTGIAFNPEDDCVQDKADFIVFEKDLTNIIPIVKKLIIS